MFNTPITTHPCLPDGVPLVADFHDDRNKLSHYHTRLDNMNGDIMTPITKFFQLQGSLETVPSFEYREATRFMQDINTRRAFLRGDYTSAKLDRDGRVIDSQDPHDIKTTFANFLRDVVRTERHIGRLIAVREFIPHEIEVRYFIRDGSILYHQSVSGVDDLPESQINAIANEFDSLSWSVDFIKHQKTGEWYCTDMGLDGLYPDDSGNSWTAISEHPDESYSPENYTDGMPNAKRLTYMK